MTSLDYPTMPTYLEVAVIVSWATETFHYHLPPELEGQVGSGHLILAPFGKQTVQGVVLRQVDRPAVAETRPVLGLVDPEPVLTAAQIALAHDMAKTCLASLADCITLMLPPGLGQQVETEYTAHSAVQASANLTHAQMRLMTLLHKRGPLRSRQIDRALPRQNWRASAQSLIRRRLLTTQTILPEPGVRPKTVRTALLACPPDVAEKAMPDLARPVRTIQLACPADEALRMLPELGRDGSKALEHRQALIHFLVDQIGPVDVSEAYTASLSNSADLQFLQNLGLVEIGEASSPPLERRQAMLRYLINESGPVDVAWLYAESGGTLNDLYALAERGLVILGENEVWRDPLEAYEAQPIEPPILTRDQAAVWNQVDRALAEAAAGRPGLPILLHGVTGSGKTEIYLRAVEAALRLGKEAIVLVPEIALTPQTVHRFMSRFPGQVGLLHSTLSQGERYETWRRARTGALPVIIGPRSALFTPLPDLGLIVVDECHDDSYYQSEGSPHYHARQAAVRYANLAGAVCLMGSATPDITSTYRANKGEWLSLHLPARILAHHQVVQAQLERLQRSRPGQQPASHYRPLEEQAEMIDLPTTYIIDMRKELQAGNRSIFSRKLQTALDRVLQEGQQAILFLNRRGTATYVFCRDCGNSLKCPRCDLPLTYHSPESALMCHHCGYRRRMPETCPVCKSKRIRQYGTGTSRVETEIQERFPSARTLRWDYETTRHKGSHEAILSHFINQRADILIGTQMLAKGLDLPLVTLVGVVLADVGLNLPDYRASERTFQVLTQVAGRAGRSPLGGEVILQTFQPEHYVIRTAAGHDYQTFYRQELEHRREIGYPPFSNLVRMEYQHNNDAEAERAARKQAAQIQGWIAAEERRSTYLIGPAPCLFARLGGLYRWQIILRGPDPASLLRGRSLDGWKIEVDPPNLL
jgi:primosomal protein N' (replication factor Y)